MLYKNADYNHMADRLRKDRSQLLNIPHRIFSECNKSTFLGALSIVSEFFANYTEQIRNNLLTYRLYDPMDLDFIMKLSETIFSLTLCSLNGIKEFNTDDIFSGIRENVFQYRKEFENQIFFFKHALELCFENNPCDEIPPILVAGESNYMHKKDFYEKVGMIRKQLRKDIEEKRVANPEPPYNDYSEFRLQKNGIKNYFTEGQRISDFDDKLKVAEVCFDYLSNGDKSFCTDETRIVYLKAMFREIYFCKSSYNGISAKTIAENLADQIAISNITISHLEAEFLNEKLYRGLMRESSRLDIYKDVTEICDILNSYLTESYMARIPIWIIDSAKQVFRKFINIVWVAYLNMYGNNN